jgi:hypothetical protein
MMRNYSSPASLIISLLSALICGATTSQSWLQNTATIGILQTTVGATPTGPPIATGTASVSAIPLEQNGTAPYTSPWTLGLSVFQSPSDITTGLSLSWPLPPDTGLPYGNFCMIWLTDLLPKTFTGEDPSAQGSGNCTSLLGYECAYDVEHAAFQWGLSSNCNRDRPNFIIPSSCMAISGRTNPNITRQLS